MNRGSLLRGRGISLLLCHWNSKESVLPLEFQNRNNDQLKSTDYCLGFRPLCFYFHYSLIHYRACIGNQTKPTALVQHWFSCSIKDANLTSKGFNKIDIWKSKGVS